MRLFDRKPENRKAFWIRGLGLLCLTLMSSAGQAWAAEPELETFSFITAGDMRNFAGPAKPGKSYFDGVCAALQKVGPGAFMISPGDCDPQGPIRAILDRYLGRDYVWYPVIGNHEAENTTNMTWLHRWAKAGIPYLVRRGPAGAEDSAFSFDYANSHFVVMNNYYNGTSDRKGRHDISEAQFAWLEQDLSATRQPLLWVIGHEPIRSLPDMDSGRVRHGNEPVSTNTLHLSRFVDLLKQHHVRAYICGHTHNTSVARIQGIWQLDSGHSRGAGDPGAPSTFFKFRAAGRRAWVDIYRADPTGRSYHLRNTVELD